MSSKTQSSKHIVITGGTSGIGRELVRQLHGHNRLSVIGRASPRLDTLVQTFHGIQVYAADLSSPDCVVRAADAILKTNERIDVLINNAAVQYAPHFVDEGFCVETIEQEINTNLTAPAVLIYSLLPALRQSEKPLILNVNSGLGLVPKTGSAVYCATKGGLNILSQSLRNQFEGTNIRVAQAFLPLVDTEMTKGRGSAKLSASEAAAKIIRAMQASRLDTDIGKVKLLRLLIRLWPSLAREIMRRA